MEFDSRHILYFSQFVDIIFVFGDSIHCSLSISASVDFVACQVCFIIFIWFFSVPCFVDSSFH